MSDETDFHREVEANFCWNFSVNLLDIAFIMFGLNLVSQATIMPLLVSQLTDSGGLLSVWVREPRHIQQRSLAAAA